MTACPSQRALLIISFDFSHSLPFLRSPSRLQLLKPSKHRNTRAKHKCRCRCSSNGTCNCTQFGTILWKKFLKIYLFQCALCGIQRVLVLLSIGTYSALSPESGRLDADLSTHFAVADTAAVQKIRIADNNGRVLLFITPIPLLNSLSSAC